MDRQAKIDFILDHYETPRNYGALSDATVVQKGGNPGCGDIITLYLRINGDNRVEEITFEGEGCTISQAATSMVTEMLKGKTLQEVEEIPLDTILDLLGHEIVATRLRCATLGMATAKEAVTRFKREEMLRQAGVDPALYANDTVFVPVDEVDRS
ncbi:MAG: iron-sulfur cluster assembly scaffold protein [Anaerolineae bacterium]|nr:iron-sulfur cluster assembly scaffold protein [Anaerolineae bacterium]